MNALLILLGKSITFISRFLNLGHGSTWPGHIALTINKNFIKEVLNNNHQLKIILIAGTNGKTTTGKLTQTILEYDKKKVFQNESGANLLNGIASSLIRRCNIVGKTIHCFAIFEVDENTLPLALKEITPSYLIVLNLFRDQLDRYGEVNTIASKWQSSFEKLTSETTFILNADDPQIAHLGKNLKGETEYFGLNDKKLAIPNPQHASDSAYCPNCSSRLYYHAIYYSHLGNWECKNCGNERSRNIFSTPPSSKLLGVYNLYNILAALLVCKKIGVSGEITKKSLKEFIPAFGRQEVLHVADKRVQIFLSKNPTSFNESLRTIKSMRAKNVLFVLNDRIPDGQDVSWIWDVDAEEYIEDFNYVIVSGDRAFDMGLRIKYCSAFQNKFQIAEDLKTAIALGLKKTPKSKTLYILPTYSAMLEVRKILLGKKIL